MHEYERRKKCGVSMKEVSMKEGKKCEVSMKEVSLKEGKNVK